MGPVLDGGGCRARPMKTSVVIRKITASAANRPTSPHPSVPMPLEEDDELLLLDEDGSATNVIAGALVVCPLTTVTTTVAGTYPCNVATIV